jgi:signal peptidase I
VVDYKKVLKNDYVKTAIAIVFIIAIVLGFFFGLGLALGTSVPVRVVESGSMCTDIYGCDGWSHPFEQTLHVGDIIIIQSVNPEELNADYPNSDIIVYQNPNLRGNPEATPIVHRIVAKYQVNGTWYFQTKGDGNGVNWPTTPTTSEYDSHTLWSTGEGVPEDLVLGKVVMRIPYFGWITLFMRGNSWALPLVIGLIMLLIIVEFILPVVRSKNKKKQTEQQISAQPQP